MAINVDERADGDGAASRSGTATAPRPAPHTGRRPRSAGFRFGWIVEAVACVVAYEVFEYARDHVMGSTSSALRHAERLVRIERVLGLYREHGIQQAFAGWPRFMAFWNLYYGTVHFVAPVVALIVLYRKAPARYLRWRNTLVVMQLVALAVFIVLPLMPPRLMPPRFGFIDGAAHYFNFGPQVVVRFGPNGTPDPASVKAFGNLYAAMPSLHVGWATWTALALLPLVRPAWGKALLLAYPFVTFFAVVVSANHWILDGVGGWTVLTIGWVVVVSIERWRSTRRRPDQLVAPLPSLRSAESAQSAP